MNLLGKSQSLFIQGWGTTRLIPLMGTKALVSIPFHSGLGYYLLQVLEAGKKVGSQSLFIQGWGTTCGFLTCPSSGQSLNPFSFRAGVLLCGVIFSFVYKTLKL